MSTDPTKMLKLDSEEVSKNLLNRQNKSSFLKFSEFNDVKSTIAKELFICSPCDEGVARNGGRRGARFAPLALKNILQRMQLPQGHDLQATILELQPFPEFVQATDFKSANSKPFDDFQTNQQQSVAKAMQLVSPRQLIHLGGGHDHVYPLLMALSEKYQNHYKKMIIINLDAHTDTRVDPVNHSGTPFRQLAKNSKLPFDLYQIGIKNFANPKDNFAWSYPHAQQIRIEGNSFAAIESQLHLISQENCPIILSLDADYLSSSVMEAVSAVAIEGGHWETVLQILSWYKDLNQELNVLGVYEYNPLYDNLSQKGARVLANLIYNFLI